MSTYSRAPAHQNKFAFKHNPNSKKTKKILSLPNVGVCRRCHDIIEWRKKYRKYKPLTKPGRCTGCKELTVRAAYHHLCRECARERHACPKCMKPLDDYALEEEMKDAIADELDMLEGTKGAIPGMSERERRSAIRALHRKAEGAGMEVEVVGGGSDGGEKARKGGYGGGVGAGCEGDDGEGEEEEVVVDEEEYEEEEEDGGEGEEDEEAGVGGGAGVVRGGVGLARREVTMDRGRVGAGDGDLDAALRESDLVGSVLTRALAEAKRREGLMAGGGVAR